MEIKAFIFDLGGVYFHNGTRKAIEILDKKHGLGRDILEDIYYSKESFDLRKGNVISTDYWSGIREKYPNLKHINFREIWYSSFTINEDVARVVEQLSGKYILGIFSDNIFDRIEYLENKYNFSKYFNFKIYSFNLGFSKEDPRTIEILNDQLNAYNILASEALFIDDSKRCLFPAEDIGMHTLLYDCKKSLSLQLKNNGVQL